MNTYFLLAGVASFITFCLHTWVAGPRVAVPLLDSKELRATAKYTNYYCWHLVTIVLAGMTFGYSWAAVRPETSGLALYITIQAFVFMLWSLILVMWKEQPFLRLPQWILFLVIGGFGVLGIFMPGS